MTGIELLWGIATNLISTQIDNFIPKHGYLSRLEDLVSKTQSEFEEQYPSSTTEGKIPFHKSQTFYAECLKFRFYTDLDAATICTNLKADTRIAPCKEEEIKAFITLLFTNADKDEVLRQYFVKENFAQEVFNLGEKINQLFEAIKQAPNTNTINITGHGNIVLQDVQNLTAIINELHRAKIDDIVKQEQRLYKYYKEQAAAYTSNIFEEKQVTLQDIYIEPYYGVHKECYTTEEPLFFEVFQDTYESLHSFIDVWINKAILPNYIDERYVNKRVLLLLGQPGQGKSSFCARLMHDVFHQQTFTSIPVFRINFRRIPSTHRLLDDPLTALFEFLNNREDLGLSKEIFNNSILLLDGLDELVMQERVSASEIDDFVKKLLKDVDNNFPNIRIIITSRHQVNTDRVIKDSLVLNLSVLTKAQQHEWLVKYRLFHPDIALDKDTLDSFHAQKYIAELSNQAILLYLLAQVHTKEKPIESKANRATLYKQLFDLLLGRRWADNGKQIPALEGLDAKTLRLFLREIAFTIFKSDYEYIHKTQVPLIISSSGLEGKLAILDKEGLKGLMLAFYMQEANKASTDEDRTDDKSNYAIEFMHKSLQEYLVAEHIWENIKEIAETKRDGDFYIKDWNDTLKILAKCFNDKFITPNITDLLIEIIKNADEFIRTTIFERLEKFLPRFLEHDFLYAYDRSKNKKPIHASLNTFYGFLNVISHSIKNQNYLNENSKQEFAYLLFILRRYRIDCYINLSHTNLIHTNLSGADLISADLIHTDLSGADLISADLSRANLSGAYLTSANLSGAYLIGANLIGANLIGAYLSGAYLTSANLTSANLNGAGLDFADLSFADLSDTNLSLEQLASTKSLFNCYGIPPEIETQLRQSHPHLFKKPY